jgi:patatin-like phospholipase/acyl hydrolase
MSSGAQDVQAHRFRILALDGGGVRGAFTASVLAELEKSTGTRCADRFDLITGTSTGGLLAIALALGHPAQELCDLYRRNGKAIFPLEGRAGRFLGMLRQFVRPKYGQKALRAALKEVLGDAKFGAALTRLVIPAYDITTGRVFIFKTRHLDRFRYDVGVEAVEIAMCTSAAPTYFPANLIPEHNAAYVDGGVWANAPMMVAITEAVGFLGKHLDELDILSVGTTQPVADFSDETRSGLIGWGPRMASLLMTAQSQGSVAMAQVLCRNRFHRINAVVPNDWIAMDSTKSVDKLIGTGRAEAAKDANYRVVSERFLNGTPVKPFGAAGASS